MSDDVLARILRRTVVTDSGCLQWTGGSNRGGYGNITIEGTTKSVHRVAFQLLVGPIPDGLDLGHVCHDSDESCDLGKGCPHRSCWRPDHLRPMTKSENSQVGRNGNRFARKTHCVNGHELTEETIYTSITPGAGHLCRVCVKLSQRRTRARKRAGMADRPGETGQP